ncbi:LytR/AlgR family response regulator transcription factor [Lacrimispora sp. 38-1]|uniref:LytR/AlgR family response regulator transcription factor n=1 Tax=Lacrimispora sp. 38-1 TaxID=3125778 RepID=UPI003CEB12CA
MMQSDSFKKREVKPFFRFYFPFLLETFFCGNEYDISGCKPIEIKEDNRYNNYISITIRRKNERTIGGVMSIRVVVVDNSEELLVKLTGILNDMSEIELCGSFPEAIAAMQYIKENPVDLVFSDIVMPDISGITLASKLYELPDPPEVVLLSGIPGFSLEAFKIRVFAFIVKPYTRAQISKVIRLYGEKQTIIF